MLCLFIYPQNVEQCLHTVINNTFLFNELNESINEWHAFYEDDLNFFPYIEIFPAYLNPVQVSLFHEAFAFPSVFSVH